MYEQDYLMNINSEIIRTIVKLVFDKDIRDPIDVLEKELKSEDKKILENIYDQIDLEEINKIEEKIWMDVKNGEKRALERALLLYIYLNEKDEEFFVSNNYKREKIGSVK